MSETGDGLDHLRIPFEKIKFGKKLEVQGYGTVFEGEFDGQKVALKQLNITNLANIKPKLLAEILTISRFRQHPNLVALLGFCDEKSNEITLVYEYVESGNLEDKMRKRLTTIQRLEICLGAARGLDYLHTGVDVTTPGIVHGNIKLSKILLNSDVDSSKFEAKVSSFGLSKIVPGKAQKSLEDEVTEKPTKESDVYSFGVLLLEVLCGVSELVDTDDYQERHVSELVPKKMKQNKLRKTVHFDIRKEIKTEALETYAKIACQCVMEDPVERPQMAQVVEELEKALRLQGGEVTYVQIPGSRSIAGATDESVVEKIPSTEEDVKDLIASEELDDAGEAKPENENIPTSIEEDVKDLIGENKLNDLGKVKPENVNIPTIEKDVQNLIASDKLDDAGEANGGELRIAGTISESSNGVKNSLEATKTESVPNHTHMDNAKTGIDTVPNSKEESNTTVETKEDTSKITIKDAEKEIDPDTTKETIHAFNSDKKSKITEENKEDDASMEIITTSESGNVGDTSTSTDQANLSFLQEVDESNILKLESRSFSEFSNDELEHLRIPGEKIKFGQKIDVHGYGTMFEGEYNDQEVALKRLNITNLGNIKPELLSAILTISKFRQHPNLVALIGFCDENNKELVLVYEYVSGGSLADKMNKHLTTIQRLQICLGAARGLEYLHSGVDSNPCIIHGNLKLPKILLSSYSSSSNFEAKVSGFGLPKLLPGHVEIGAKSTGKLTKESDVYSFGVLLLEVLCGVPELVDIDDYQERHVTDLVPKRLEQNMLRKIVHFDIRDEITTESLETYAKIACRCVMKNPEERPSMSEVVVELEKALRLQGGKVSDVEIYGSSNGNSLPVDEDDHEADDNDETMSSSITKEESKGIEEAIDYINLEGGSFPVPVSDSNDVESVSETKNSNNMNDHESTGEITINLNSNNEESNMFGENEVYNQSKITTSSSKSDNGEDSNPAMDGKVSDMQVLASSNGNSQNEAPVGEDDMDNGETMSSNIIEEESKVIEETTDNIALGGKVSDVQLLGSSSNGSNLPEVSVGEDDQDRDDNDATMSSTISHEGSKVIEKTASSSQTDIAQEDSEKEKGDNMNVPNSTEEITVDLKSNEESKIIGENKVNNGSKITTSSSMKEPLPNERSATEEKGNGLMMNTHSLEIEQIMEVQKFANPDGNEKAILSNTKTPEMIVNIRGGDFGNPATQTQKSESKRSNSTCSESSNGDDTTPSDYLLPKSPDNVKKTSRGSINCCYCSCYCCSWWHFISDRIVLYGGLFWNKLVSFFTWMTCQCSSKKD